MYPDVEAAGNATVLLTATTHKAYVAHLLT
jgi:hypothetical protein